MTIAVMDLTWLDPVHASARDIAGAVGVVEAARALDYAHRLGPTTTTFTAGLRHGWHGDPPLVAVSHDRRGRVTGVLEVALPHWANTHVGSMNVTVDPAVRRQGVGRALYGAGVDRIRADGRTLVFGVCFDRPPAMGFAKALGLDQVAEDVYRRQDVRTVDWDRLDHEYADVERHAAGYELTRVPGPTPDALMADVTYLTGAINDAPVDAKDVQDEAFPPERIRGFEVSQAAHRRRYYRLIARVRGTGAVAGHTVVGVDIERPWHAWQYDTSVLRAHRGHRLGLYLKIGMLRWLADEEPQLRTLYTANAASNTHMVRVNDALGYYVVGRAISWQQHL